MVSDVKLLQDFFPYCKSAEIREIEIVLKEEVVWP